MEVRPPAAPSSSARFPNETGDDEGGVMSTTSSSARFLNETVRAQMQNQGASQVWADVTALAKLPGVLDLGQGWPDFGASDVAREAASSAILNNDDPKTNQYSPPPGAPELVHAVDRYYRATGSVPCDSVERECVVTTSATEALYACMQALINPGEEVVFLEPFFPWYIAHARIFGAKPRTVRLKLEDRKFRLDMDDLRAAFVAGAGKVKAFIHCCPHNPTGLVFTADETREIAKLCVEFGVVIIADEVYERCTFGNVAMRRIADCDVQNVRAQTLVIGTASKLLNLSGWRVGWVLGPKPLINAIRIMHAYCTFCAPTPLQIGVARALLEIADEADGATRKKALDAAQTQNTNGWNSTNSTRLAAFEQTRGALVPDLSAQVMAKNVKILSSALHDSGVVPCVSSGGYFLVADVATTGMTSTEFCKALATGPAKVAAVPMDVFFDPNNENVPNTLVRFAVCKQRGTIEKCAEAIRAHPVGKREGQ
tara:strand:- start:1124 stop:2575 length:1452 start_codon:yes stop_codon:yes gene_type:complete